MKNNADIFRHRKEQYSNAWGWKDWATGGVYSVLNSALKDNPDEVAKQKKQAFEDRLVQQNLLKDKLVGLEVMEAQLNALNTENQQLADTSTQQAVARATDKGGISPLKIGGIILALALVGGGIVWFAKRKK